MAQQNSQVNIAQQNAMARGVVLGNAIERMQNIFSRSVNPANEATLNIAPRNVGLIKGFVVRVEADFTNGASAVALTKLGPANIIKQFVFTDLQNNTRIQTAGWHVHAVNTARGSRPFGLADQLDGSPIDYGNNWNVISAPAAPAAAATGKIVMYYYVPLAYSDSDLRGAIYANVVNATMNLQLAINTNAFVASGDATEAVYVGGPGALNSVKVDVYQHYLDQLPMQQGGAPVLPVVDLSTIYELKNTTLTALTANQDFPIAYANFRSFLSTTVIYDNGGTLNVGSDINYWALTSANYTNVFKVTPNEVALFTRMRNGVDYPAGLYYFDHRSRPINTIQYGNIELNINASSVAAGAKLLVGFEDFAMINVISGAGSLPAGG